MGPVMSGLPTKRARRSNLSQSSTRAVTLSHDALSTMTSTLMVNHDE